MKCKTLVAALTLIGALSAPRARADLSWGVNGHPLVSYPGTTYEQQLDLAKSAGFASYRVDVTGPAKADSLGTLLNLAKARSVQVLPVLVQQGNLGSDTAQALYQANFNFAFALVGRYKAAVRAWELANEVENFAIIQPCEFRDDGTQWSCQWGPGEGDDPLEYVGARWAKVSAVLRGLSEGASAADPSVIKVMGSAGWGHTASFRRMQNDGLRWDVSVWHWYSDEANLTWALPQLAAYGKPIWITEFNRGGGSQTGEQPQADDLVAKIGILRRLSPTYNITAAHIYELMDEPYWAPNFEAYMGLVHLVKSSSGSWALGTTKPAYGAVAAALGAVTTPPQPPPPGSPQVTGETSFRTVAGGICMDVAKNSLSAGATIIQWTCQSVGNQTFLVGPLDSTSVNIKPQSSKLCLRPSGAALGSALVQTTCSASDLLQRFTMVPTGAASTYQIKSSSGLCVGPKGGATSNSAPMEVGDCSNVASRSFVAPGLR